MSYMLIVRKPRGQRLERTEEEGQATYDSMLNFADSLAKRGVLLAAESLRDDSEGVRISTREGKTTIVDGPFTESKEMVGGIFLLDVTTREEAVVIARQCPAVEFATLEVRELAPCNER